MLVAQVIKMRTWHHTDKNPETCDAKFLALCQSIIFRLAFSASIYVTFGTNLQISNIVFNLMYEL
jgi:hypothetical protein